MLFLLVFSFLFIGPLTPDILVTEGLLTSCHWVPVLPCLSVVLLTTFLGQSAETCE